MKDVIKNPFVYLLLGMFVFFPQIASAATINGETIDLKKSCGAPKQYEYFGVIELSCLKPTTFKDCKTIEEVQPAKPKVLHRTDYNVDMREQIIEINNKTEQPYTHLYIDHQKYSSTILYTSKATIHIKPGKKGMISFHKINRQNRVGRTNSRLQGSKIISVRAALPTRVICKEIYSEKELEIIKKENQEAAKLLNLLEEKKHYREKIFSNCIEDKLPPLASKEYKQSILLNCQRIADAPSIWNRIKYDYLAQ